MLSDSKTSVAWDFFFADRDEDCIGRQTTEKVAVARHRHGHIFGIPLTGASQFIKWQANLRLHGRVCEGNGKSGRGLPQLETSAGSTLEATTSPIDWLTATNGIGRSEYPGRANNLHALTGNLLAHFLSVM
ncbi:MAG TPA: hypothetical protein VIF60_02060 [Burkholderiaceae bacterium]|jgi:hypothetical protein